MKTKIKLMAFAVGLLSILPTTSVWAGSTTYYAALKTSVSNSGGGTVYAGTSNPATEASYETTSTSSSQTSTTTDEEKTFYAFAQANEGFEFAGWATSDGGAVCSTDNPYEVTVKCSSSIEGSPTTTTVWANFKKKVLDAFGITFVTSDAGTYTVDGEVPANKTGLTEVTTVELASSDPNFLNWTVNGEPVNGNPYELTCIKDTAVSAVFLTADQVAEATTFEELTAALTNDGKKKITIPVGTDIVIAKGATVTVPSGKQLVVNGTLAVVGTLTNNGAISGNGKFVKISKIISQGEIKTLYMANGEECPKITEAHHPNIWPKYRKTTVEANTPSVSGNAVGCATTEWGVYFNGKVTSISQQSPVAVKVNVNTANAVNDITAVVENGDVDSINAQGAYVLFADCSIKGPPHSSDANRLNFNGTVDCAGKKVTFGLKRTYSDFAPIILNGTVDFQPTTDFQNATVLAFGCSSVTIKNIKGTNGKQYFYDCGTPSSTCSITLQYQSSSSRTAYFYNGYYKYTFSSSDTGKCYVYGGSYTSDPTTYIPSPLNDELYAPQQGGFYVVQPKPVAEYVVSVGDAQYESLEEAIEKAPAGSTITLIAGLDLTDKTVTIASGKQVMIDLNKHQIAGGKIVNNGTLVITDYATANESVVEADIENHGTLEVIFGTYKGDIVNKAGMLTIYNGAFDGSISSGGGALELNGGHFAQDVTDMVTADNIKVFVSGGKYYVCEMPNGTFYAKTVSSVAGYGVTPYTTDDYNLLKSYVSGKSLRTDYGETDWVRLAELLPFYEVYNNNRLDPTLVFDRAVAAESLKFNVQASQTMTLSLDSDVAVDEKYRTLSEVLAKFNSSSKTYKSLWDDGITEVAVSFSNVSITNAGTLCKVMIELWETVRAPDYTSSNRHMLSNTVYVISQKQFVIDAGDNVAMIRPAEGAATFYPTLKEACVAAKNGETVMLCNDCTTCAPITTPCSFKFDMNGFAFTGAITAGDGYELTATDLGDGKTQYEVAREAVAQIGETKYASLAEAIEAATESGATIDVVRESALTVAEDVELTVTSGKLVAAIPEDDVLELKDGTDAALTWPTNVESAKGHIIVTGGRYSDDPSAFLAEGLEAKKVGEKFVVGVKIITGDTETETIVTTEKQESKVAELEETEKAEVFKEVAADKVAEVVEKIEQSTKVEGVKLTVAETDTKPAGIVAVVETATSQDETFAEAVKSAAEVSVKVEVEVKPTEYIAPSEQSQSNTGKVAFKLMPKATVTVKQNETELKQVVPVTNDMIDQNQKIAVSIYTGFKPAVITHDDDKGVRIETFEGDQIVYNEATGVATVLISHFSTLTSFGNANEVPAPKVYVAQIGETPYETLAAAFAAVTGGETVTLLANCALDANTSIPSKDVTITAVDPSISLTLKTGGYGGSGANVTFKNMKLIGVAQNSGTQYTTGLIGVKKETYENCTMIGPFCTYGAASFTGCVFKSVDYEGDENNLSNMPAPSPYTKMQSLWVYVGNCLVTVDQCKFLTYDRAVKIFGDESKTFNVRFTNTDFYCQTKNKSAIMVGVDHLKETNIIIDEKTVIAHPQYSDEVEGGYALVYSEYGELNGGTSEATYLAAHPEAPVRGQYAVGEDIVLDDSGKITGGTFSKLVGETIIAEGFEGKPDPATGKVIVEEIAAVAKIGETVYETLSAAVAAVKAGWTVTLIADCAEAVTGGEVPFVLEQGGRSFTGSIAAADGFKTVASPIAGDDSIRYMPVDEEPIITAAMTKVASGFYQSGANYGASAGFYITSKAGLEFFRDIINNLDGEAAAYRDSAAGAGFDLTAHRFSGKTINLLADVDLNNEVWTPIGRATDRDMLAGTFDGNNHVVSNLKTVYRTEGKDQAGFFGYSNKTFTIKNLTLQNVDITGFAYVGALISTASKADSEIVNCHVVGSVSISAVSSYVGGIVGHGYCSVSNCSVEATGGTGISVTGGGILVGGIYGYAASNPGNIADCSVSGLSISLAQNYVAGGIVGGVDRPLTVSGCSVEDVAIECQRGPYLGYVVGSIQGGDGILAITDCAVEDSTLLSHVDKYTEKDETYLVQCGAYDAPTCYYVGSNVETDGNGKVIDGTFEWLPDGLVAAGYEKVAQGTTPETWVVQEKPAPVVPIAVIVGKEGTYTSIDDAILAAGADDVIRMLADADVGDVMGAYRSKKGAAYKLLGNLTIDLDNHEVKLGSVALYESDDGGKLLFKNGKININGAMGVAMEANDAASVFYTGKHGTLEFNSVDIVGTNVAASVIFRTYTQYAPLMRFDDCTISIEGCNDFAHTVQRVEFEDTQVQIKNNKGRVFRDNDGHTLDGGSNVTLLRSSVSVDGISGNGGEEVNAIVLDASSLSFKNYQTESMGANKCNIELKNGSSFVLDEVGSHGFTNGKLVVNDGCTVDVKNVAYLGLNVTDGSVFKAGSKVSVSNCCTTENTGKTAYYSKDIAMWSSGSSVVIENGADVEIDGRLIVKSGSLDIANGRFKSVEVESGTLTLTGGIYTTKPDATYIAEGYEAASNPDEATKAAYPWKVQEPTVKEQIVINIDPTAHEGQGEQVPVVVTKELAKEILKVEELPELQETDIAKIVEKLETKGEDGMTGWQKYAAGFSQTDKHPLAPKGKSGENGQLVLVTSLVAPKPLSVDTGVKVKYILMKGSDVNANTGLPTRWEKFGEPMDTPEFPVEVNKLDPETYWKIEVEYTATKQVQE